MTSIVQDDKHYSGWHASFRMMFLLSDDRDKGMKNVLLQFILLWI